ncbi:TIGR03936 family radical SAM-associated protein [Ruminococcus sp. OA3]|uniref:TIGR03936 family radical SAM-associated protein n=1 Tax=Ruminococcus sp. OA3 TaxID=2914164 RepID=UPI001F06185D|nr:TIGR03936 family radical SAM-associated protein [Ruminococcus sp. OA3]MCH1983524.1 TIGR03936 family radical SAM-associated protein [Ruminococcus sp. OA3]
MKVRVKFEKKGAMKFIGHLDMMRYFQKAIRRAGIDVAYSEGFSPHMIMSFAAPLGVGVTSSGEYFDMEVRTPMSTADFGRCFNAVMAEGIRVMSVREIPDQKASKAMSLVAAADYYVDFREGREPKQNYRELISGFMAQPSIIVMKKTKRSEQETDIRPLIYRFELIDGRIFMQLATGSVHNLKPELVMETFYHYIGEEVIPFAWMVHRDEVYANTGDDQHLKLVTLESLGKIIG